MVLSRIPLASFCAKACKFHEILAKSCGPPFLKVSIETSELQRTTLAFAVVVLLLLLFLISSKPFLGLSSADRSTSNVGVGRFLVGLVRGVILLLSGPMAASLKDAKNTRLNWFVHHLEVSIN